MRLLYADQPQLLDTLDFDKLHSMLNPVQDMIAPEYVTAYDDLPVLLTRLGERGIKLGIFTSGTRHMVVRNFGVSLPELQLTNLYKDSSISDAEKLRQFEITMQEHFHIPQVTVVTCDDVPTHKPDPASLTLAMERLGVSAQNALIFGDHAVDMQAGSNAGAPTRVGVTHGFNDDTTLLAAGATQVVHSLDELTQQL